LKKVCTVSNRKQMYTISPVGFSAPSYLSKALACFDFNIYDDRFGFGQVRTNTVKCFIQSMFCKTNTLCGTLGKGTYSLNINAWNKFW